MAEIVRPAKALMPPSIFPDRATDQAVLITFKDGVDQRLARKNGFGNFTYPGCHPSGRRNTRPAMLLLLDGGFASRAAVLLHEIWQRGYFRAPD
jgi:hypothetical protein